jgi:hypothetical protein
MQVGQMQVGQMLVGQRPVSQMPVGQMFFGQKTWNFQDIVEKFQDPLIRPVVNVVKLFTSAIYECS